MNTNNKIRNPHIAALILATASTSYAYSSRANLPSTSSWINTACTAAAAVAGAIAVVGLLRKQCDERGFKVGGGPCGRGGGGGSTSEKRKGSCCDDTSDTISVEGSVMVTLPTWAIAASEDFFSRKYHTDIEMMSLAIHLSDRNISEGTGGPFGAAIFERHPDKGYCTLVSIGMNRVVPLGNSTLHGETVAIQLAQRRVGSYTLMLDEGGNSSDGGEDGLFWDEGEGGVAGDEEGKKEENKEEEAASAGGDGGKAGAEAGSKKEKRKRQFELFTSCEPCAMCLGATLWSGVSRMVCGATKDDAQSIGFDEGPVFEESYKHLERMGCKVTRNIMREEAASVLRRYGNSGLIYNR